jgi:cyanophycinase-like exopeptidase
VAVLPHFGTFGRSWTRSALAGRPSEQVVLAGIDERTAAVWSGDGWRALGEGAVTLVRADGERRFASGELIEGIPAPRP